MDTEPSVHVIWDSEGVGTVVCIAFVERKGEEPLDFAFHGCSASGHLCRRGLIEVTRSDCFQLMKFYVPVNDFVVLFLVKRCADFCAESNATDL